MGFVPRLFVHSCNSSGAFGVATTRGEFVPASNDPGTDGGRVPWFVADIAPVTVLVAPGGNGFGGKILLSSGHQSNIRIKQRTRTMIDFRSMLISEKQNWKQL